MPPSLSLSLALPQTQSNAPLYRQVISAYLLAALADPKKANKEAVKKILASVGAEVDDAELDRFFAALGSQNIYAVAEAGKAKIGASAAPAAAAGHAPAAAGAAKGGAKGGDDKKAEAAPKKKEPEPEPSEVGIFFLCVLAA